MEYLAGFIISALALTGSPGPNTLSLAGVSAAFGWRRGLGYMAGLDLGMALVITIVGSGVIGLLAVIPGVSAAITLLAAAYFIYLAFKIATAPPVTQASIDARPPGWKAAILVSLANPKAYAAMGAMFSGFTLAGGSAALDGLLKAALLLAVIVFVNVCWLFAGSGLTPLLRNPTANRAINIAFAGSLLGSVVLALAL